MDLQEYAANNVTILQPEGRIDSHTMSVLRERIDAITLIQPPQLVIDLTEVNFLDSSGLATLIYGMKQCRAGGGDLCLCNPAQAVRMILELTRLDKAMEIYPNAVVAIASFQGGSHPQFSLLSHSQQFGVLHDAHNVPSAAHTV